MDRTRVAEEEMGQLSKEPTTHRGVETMEVSRKGSVCWSVLARED
jgi:hypothetical protein